VIADVTIPSMRPRRRRAAEALGAWTLSCQLGSREAQLEGTTAELWDAVFAVNLRSHFLVARRALRS